MRRPGQVVPRARLLELSGRGDTLGQRSHGRRPHFTPQEEARRRPAEAHQDRARRGLRPRSRLGGFGSPFQAPSDCRGAPSAPRRAAPFARRAASPARRASPRAHRALPLDALAAPYPCSGACSCGSASPSSRPVLAVAMVFGVFGPSSATFRNRMEAVGRLISEQFQGVWTQPAERRARRALLPRARDRCQRRGAGRDGARSRRTPVHPQEPRRRRRERSRATARAGARLRRGSKDSAPFLVALVAAAFAHLGSRRPGSRTG